MHYMVAKLIDLNPFSACRLLVYMLSNFRFIQPSLKHSTEILGPLLHVLKERVLIGGAGQT